MGESLVVKANYFPSGVRYDSIGMSRFFTNLFLHHPMHATKVASSHQETTRRTRKWVCAEYGIRQEVSAIGLIAVSDERIRTFLAEGLSAVGAGAIILGGGVSPHYPNISYQKRIPESELIACDFFITDNESNDIDIVRCMKSGIVPIMPSHNAYADILKDFDPMKFEGNGFFFAKNDPFSIFARVVSYLENRKFPEDRRVLIKNVTSTF